jgi:hypothetical protein
VRPASLERRAFLAGAVLCVVLLLGLVWLAGRRSGGEIGLPSSFTAADSALREEHVSRLEDPLPAPERVALAATASRPAPPAEEPPAPAPVGGRLSVDGLPVAEGRARLRAEDGSWVGHSALDIEGRFSFSGVPIAAHSLTFELPSVPSNRRALLLPAVPVSSRPGRPAQLDLDWTTQQVNVRVVDAGMSGIPGRVSVTGPGYDASVETADDGTVELALVGEGRFSFDAEALGGRQARAETELDPGSGLVSVVIVAGDGRGR